MKSYLCDNKVGFQTPSHQKLDISSMKLDI